MSGKKPSLGRGLAELSPAARAARRHARSRKSRRFSSAIVWRPCRSICCSEASISRAPTCAPNPWANWPIPSNRAAWCSPSWCGRCRGPIPLESQRYEIIAGERRWRAAQMAGLAEIPAVIRDVPDEDAVAMALIENIQREDLNPLEEARALLRYRGVRADASGRGRGGGALARRGQQFAAADGIDR